MISEVAAGDPAGSVRADGGRRVLQAFGSVIMAGLAVKSAGLVKEVVVAAAYGRSEALDAFLIALLLPSLLINVVAESMNQALVPVLVRVRVRRDWGAAQRVFSNTVLGCGGILAATAVAVGLAARPLLDLMGSHFSASNLDLARGLLYVLLPCAAMGGIASVFAAVLNTAERFALPALSPLAISAASVILMATLHGRLGIWALALGMVTGTFLQLAVLSAATHGQGYKISPRWYGADEATREVGRRFWPLVLSAIVASGGLVVDQTMAAMLPAGSVSSLVFAGRFVSVCLALGAGAISTVLGPAFSELVARGDWMACRAAVRAWSIRSAAISFPLAVALVAGAPLLVRLTLQHGSFSAIDSRVVAPVLAMSAIQIPFFVVSRVFYRFIAAVGRNDLILYCGSINLVLDVVLNLALMRTMGVAGIALATSLWAVATFAFLWFWSAKLLAASSPARKK